MPESTSPVKQFSERLSPARLALSDGSIWRGKPMGALGTTYGELVFNTCLTGYQEILTDPSYRGQVVLMTYPEIGNYGVNPEDVESETLHVAGLVVKRLSSVTSSWRAVWSLDEYLKDNHLVGIQGIDTRAVTRRLRTAGVMHCGITTLTDEALPDEALLEAVRSQADLSELDLVGAVTTQRPYVLLPSLQDGAMPPELLIDLAVVVDFGTKKNILRALQQFVREIRVVPADTSFEAIAAYQPDMVLLSNGPGDPRVLHGAVSMTRQLLASGIPTLGICLGHQLISLAAGATVVKLPFGHHGGNHPVQDLVSGKVMITSQNHNYAVDAETFPGKDFRVTHRSLNDGTVEGIAHLGKPVCGIQFHPEAAPGPHDALNLFHRFIQEEVRGLGKTAVRPA